MIIQHKKLQYSLQSFLLGLCILVAQCAIAQNDFEEPIDNPLGVVVDNVIAVVGEDLILKSELESKLLEISLQNESISDQELAQAQCGILDQLILNKVLKTHAVLDSLVIAPDMIDYQLNARLNSLISQVPSIKDFEEYYGKTVNQIKEQLRPLVIDYLLAEQKKEEIVSSVRVTPAEVKRHYYRTPPEQLPYYNAEVELAQVVMFPEPTEKDKLKVKKQLEELKERVINGEDFAELAKEYSEGPSAVDGGDLGYFRKGQMVSEFEDVAFKLKDGELSRIVETKFGFHLIQAVDRRDESLNARHILIKPKVQENRYPALQAKMDSIYQQIQSDSLLFEFAVGRYSMDETTKKVGGLLFNPKVGTSYFEIDELLDYDPDIYLAINDLEKGEISKPIEFTDDYGRKAYRIIYVQNQRDAHKMNLEDDFEVIKESALGVKKNQQLYEWLDGATSEIFIAVDDSYLSCPNMPIWLKDKEVK